MKFLVFAFLILSSCAFKESVPPQDTPAKPPLIEPSPIHSDLVVPDPVVAPSPSPIAIVEPKPVPKPEPKPKLRLIELRRLNSNGEILAKRMLNSQTDTYPVSEPIGIIDSNKDDLEFEVITQNATIEKSQNVQVSLMPAVEVPAIIIPNLEFRKSEGSIRFRVVKTFEALEQIRTGEISVNISVAQNEVKSEIQFKILRRPRKIETLEIESANLGQHPKRFVDLANLKLSLIRILEIKSNEKYPVEVYFDSRNAGTVTSTTERINVDAQVCSHSVSSSASNDRFDEGIVILPANEGVNKDQLWKALNNDNFTSQVLPGNTLQVGLYAVGDKARALLQNGYPKQTYQSVSVVTGCRARCGEWPNSGMFVRPDDINKYRPTTTWTNRGRPGASQDCIDLANRAWDLYSSPVQRWTDPQRDEQKIVRCALWELSNGSAPWDLDIRFCASAEPGNVFGHPAKEYWTLQKSTSSVLGGVKTSPITVKLDTSNLRGIIRHIYPAEDKIIPQSPVAIPFASQFNIFN